MYRRGGRAPPGEARHVASGVFALLLAHGGLTRLSIKMRINRSLVNIQGANLYNRHPIGEVACLLYRVPIKKYIRYATESEMGYEYQHQDIRSAPHCVALH